MGNVTITSIILICYIFVPGYLTRSLIYYSLDFWISSTFLKPFNFERPFKGILYCLGVGILVHSLFLLALHKWFNDSFNLIDFKAVFSIIGGGKYDANIYENILVSFVYFLRYIGGLLLMSLIVALLIFLVLRISKWVPSKWFVLYPPEFKKGVTRKDFFTNGVYYFVDVATTTGDSTTIYKGLATKAEYNVDGNDFTMLYLIQCSRRMLYCSDNRLCSFDSDDPNNGFASINGNFMVIPKEKILNINIKLWRMPEADLEKLVQNHPNAYRGLLDIVNLIDSGISPNKSTYEVKGEFEASVIRYFKSIEVSGFRVVVDEEELKDDEFYPITIFIPDSFVQNIRQVQRFIEDNSAKL